MSSAASRRALIVTRTHEFAASLALARRAGWEFLQAAGFNHARFLLNLTPCDVVVVIENQLRPGLLDGVEFKDLSKLDIVGIYPNYKAAHAAWRAKAQQSVDNAEMRYFVVHIHRLLDPGDSVKAAR